MPSARDLKRALRDAARKMRMRRDALAGGNCVALLYHRVIDLPTDPQLLAVSPARFEAQMDWLRRHWQVLTPEEFDERLAQGRRMPRNSALITFDDGYADNHLHARPILERHGLRAVFYISPGYIGAGREYWWDEAERLLLLNPALPPRASVERHGLRLAWDLPAPPAPGALRAAYDQLLQGLRRMPAEQRDGLLAELREAWGSAAPRRTHLPMAEAELRAFAASPAVALGAHTLLHPMLSALPPEEQRREIAGSKQALEALTGLGVTRFAYPFGTVHDFDAESMRICEEAGFRHAAANRAGIVHKGSPRFAFPRVLVRDWPPDGLAQAMRPYRI